MTSRTHATGEGLLSHQGYVEWLRRCAGRWRNEQVAPDHLEARDDQARRVDAMADEMEQVGSEGCPVCLASTR